MARYDIHGVFWEHDKAKGYDINQLLLEDPTNFKQELSKRIAQAKDYETWQKEKLDMVKNQKENLPPWIQVNKKTGKCSVISGVASRYYYEAQKGSLIY